MSRPDNVSDDPVAVSDVADNAEQKIVLDVKEPQFAVPNDAVLDHKHTPDHKHVHTHDHSAVRIKCVVQDGVISFTCPYCGKQGFESTSNASGQPVVHGRRSNKKEPIDPIDELYMRQSPDACRKYVKLIKVTTDVLVHHSEPEYVDIFANPNLNPNDLTNDELLEYNKRKKSGTLPKAGVKQNRVTLSQDEILRGLVRHHEPKYLDEYFVVGCHSD
jgi:hypothetical protein